MSDKTKCTLTDRELIEKVHHILDRMYEKKEVPLRHIPADPNGCFDLLVNELTDRLERAKQDHLDTLEAAEKYYQALNDEDWSHLSSKYHRIKNELK